MTEPKKPTTCYLAKRSARLADVLTYEALPPEVRQAAERVYGAFRPGRRGPSVLDEILVMDLPEETRDLIRRVLRL